MCNTNLRSDLNANWYNMARARCSVDEINVRGGACVVVPQLCACAELVDSRNVYAAVPPTEYQLLAPYD